MLALEVLRDWEERRLPSDALAVSEVREEARRAAVAVQKVGHFCSAVRWSDRRALASKSTESLALQEPIGGVHAWVPRC